ncbi:MAG: DUF3658 domain-containing protein [Myxococcota bacterium]
MSDAVHVIVTEAAAGSLRLARPDWQVECLVDDLSVGPLVRSEFVEHRRSFRAAVDADIGQSDSAPGAHEDAATLERLRLHVASGRHLLFWIGGWARERLSFAWLFARLLEEAPGAKVSWIRDEHALALHPRETLAAMASRATICQGQERAAACEVRSNVMKAGDVPLFRWHSPVKGEHFNTMPARPWRNVLGAQLHGDGGEEVDERLLQAAEPEWTRAALVVGRVMGHGCPLGDRFLHWRLARLCRSGRLEYEGSLGALRDFRVKRLAAG